jgi:hypothetical protein
MKRYIVRIPGYRLTVSATTRRSAINQVLLAFPERAWRGHSCVGEPEVIA